MLILFFELVKIKVLFRMGNWRFFFNLYIFFVEYVLVEI